MDFDLILEEVGGFGLYQMWIYLCVSLSSAMVGVHMLSNVFLMGVPRHRCSVAGCDNATSEYCDSRVHMAIPPPESEDQSPFSSCLQYSSVWQNQSSACSLGDFNFNKTIACKSWISEKSDFLSTGVSEWDLVCDKEYMVGLSQSIFMVGVLIGGLVFGLISDKWGRRKVFMISPILLTAASISVAYSDHFITYTMLRFLMALAISGVFAAGFVYVVEFVGLSSRLWCCNMIQVSFAIGEVLLAVAAYYVREWRKLQLILSIPLFFLLLYPLILPESVRWQIINGKTSDAKTTVLQMASVNGRKLSRDLLELPAKNYDFMLGRKKEASWLDLLRTPNLRKRSLNIFFNWFVNSLVYYGLSMSASFLSFGSPHLNFAVLAAVEIPAVIMATVVLQRFGRRPVLFLVMVLGGVACLATLVIPEGSVAVIVLAVLGKSAIAVSFAIIYIYSAEIFPTVVRNIGMGISNMFARLGGILAPIVAELALSSKSVPMAFFGICSVLAGVLALLLPETHNRVLPETIGDAEEFGSEDSRDDRVTLLGDSSQCE